MLGCPSLRAPQPKLDVLGGRAEVVVRAEQDQVVPKTQLDKQSVDRTDLNAAPTARVADRGSFDVVRLVGLQEPKRAEALDKLRPCLRPDKPLQQFLQNQTGREDLIRSLKCLPQRLYFRRQDLGVATEGQRPDAGIDEQTHGLRDRSTL